MNGLSFEKYEIPKEAPPDKKDYERLPAADRALVDRALFSQIVSRQGNQFAFADEEVKKRGKTPTSKEVELDIWKLRDEYAERFNGNNAQDAIVRRDLSRQGQNAPQNATAMLNAINAFNGDECGCNFTKPVPMTNTILNAEIKKGQGR